MSKRKTKSSATSTGTATTTPNVPSFIQGPAQDYYTQIGQMLNGGQSAPTFGATGNQQSAFQGAAQLSGPNAGVSQGMNATRDLLNFTPDNVTAGQLSETNLDPYMNPWLNDVVNTSLADLERSRQGAISTGQGQATAAGAYGGSRHGVADSLTNESALRTAASTAAGLRSQGFLNAQGAAMGDISNRLSADTGNADRGLAGAGFRLGAANQLSSQGLAGDANTRSNLGTQAALGAMERDINQENDPTNARIRYMQQIAQLLGIDPSMFTGQTINQSGTQRGSGSQSGMSFGFNWGPFSVGG